MDDSSLYTGVDGVPDGIFGNESPQETLQETINEQRKLVAELTPKLQSILNMINAEITSVNSIKRFKTATSQPEADIRSELQAAALYEDYLQNLKTRFTLVLNESRNKS